MSRKREGRFVGAWEEYLGSFNAEAVHKASNPLLVTVPVAGLSAIVLACGLIPAINRVVGLSWYPLPLFFALGAGVFSLATWLADPSRKSLVGAFQLTDVTLYGGTVITLAALSEPPASYGVVAIYMLACIFWGTDFAFSYIGLIPFVVLPALYLVIDASDYIGVILACVGLVFYITTSNRTKQEQRRNQITQRSEDVFTRLESLFGRQGEQEMTALEARTAAVVHEARNELTPTAWDLIDIEEVVQEDSEALQALKDAVESINKTVDLLTHNLQQLREKQEGRPAFSLANLPDAVAKYDGYRTADCGELPELEVAGREEYVALSIHNLVANAYDAGADKVTVRTKEINRDSVLLEVEDDGPGLPEKVRENLFRPYNTYGKRQGVGLGIYLAARIIEAAGGELRLGDTGPRGTSFVARLSRAPLGSSMGHKEKHEDET